MQILITGSNGFVGSSLMPFLENLGHDVYGIDREAKPVYPVHKNTVIADIVDIASINTLKKPYDLIIHCAAAKSDFGVSDKEYYQDNVEVTQILMDFATAQNVEKVIYYSTVSVYGHQKEPCGEEGELLSNTVYGDTKLGGEKEIEKWLKSNSNNKAVFLRPSVIYGPNNYANMYNLINQLYGNPLVTVGDGSHVKSMVSLKNLIDMTVFVMDNGFSSSLHVYNCLDKPYYSLDKLMQIIANTEGFNRPKIKIPVWLAYALITPFEVFSRITGKDLKINWNRLNKLITSTYYYAEKIREEGYVQRYTVEDEITEMVTWYKSKK